MAAPQVWEVVGGSDNGGIVVRTGKAATSSACPDRLSTGALVEELERHGGRLRYRRLAGCGPCEGWVVQRLASKDLLARPSGLWRVVGGGGHDAGILVRSGAEASSALLPERLATGALLRELRVEDQRLQFMKLTGWGPESGWVRMALSDGKPLVARLEFEDLATPSSASSHPALAAATPPMANGAPAPVPNGAGSAAGAANGAGAGAGAGGAGAERLRDPYEGAELELPLRDEESSFSYEGHPEWVRRAAAVAALFRRGAPYLPTRQARPARLKRARPLAPWQRKAPKELAEMSRKNLPGCIFGMTFPKTAEELKSDEFGAEWLTRAFHAAGTLPEDNRVSRLVRAEPLPVLGFDAAGGAAMKMLLSVEYLKPDPDLHTELFCKYPYSYEEYPASRKELSAYGDVEGPEIHCQMSLAHLFPFRTAKFYFGEICRETTNFILISETIPFGRRGKVDNGKVVEEIKYAPYDILPVCGKYQDWLLPNPAEFYCCIFRAMGRLAAWDKLGRYDEFFGPAPTWTEEEFLKQHERKPLSRPMLSSHTKAAAGVIDTALDYMRNVVPSMVPSCLLQGGALERVKEELLEMCHFFSAMSGAYQLSHPNFVAAMHQNLQADNAFFWRDERGDLDCGVLDWGGFSRVPFCLSFLGCLSGADPEILMAHEEGIIRCFRDEYHRCGGPYLEMEELLTRYRLAFITFVYDSSTYIERDIFKQAPKDEIKTWNGVLDPKFQAAFRVRCRTMTVINAYTTYHLKGSQFKDIFQKWSKGKGAAFLPEITE